ncbi:MAG TPA: UDP binding domain-containing protein, partial [Cyclobacteriaceae bacterium]
VNEGMKTRLIPHVKNYFKGSLKGKTIAMWGLAFKPHTDDIREAPALYNIDILVAEGARVKVHDPEAMPNVKKLIGDKVEYFNTPFEAAQDADALFIATEWPEFRTPDFEKLSSILKNKVIFDGRNLYDLDQMKELGYTYYSVGRETIYG